MAKITEITFNVTLAEILRGKNPEWSTGQTLVAESTGTLQDGGTPDILIKNSEGTPIVVESEFMPARTVEADAMQRLGRVVADTGRAIEQVIALRAPAALRNVAQPDLHQAAAEGLYEYCLFSSAGDENEPARWPVSGWLTGNADDLADLIENAVVSERLIVKSLETLEQGVSDAANLLREGTQKNPAVNERIAAELHQEDSVQTSRMAMAIVANALTFHGIIAGAHNIKSVEALRATGGVLPASAILREWRRILEEINYWPIFHIACEVLRPMPPRTASKILARLATVADELGATGVTGSHDLSGRMFQRLISDRKFLATFYTLPESASLLAELAVATMDVDWQKPGAALDLRIADFACGTGTLLAAAYHAVLARHRRAGRDDAKIHKKMIEQSLIATDIMPAATHLTISMLSSVHPTITFEKTQVHSLPYGESERAPGSERETGRPVALGALDLLAREHGTGIFGTGLRAVGGHGESEVRADQVVRDDFTLAHESCDLVIMNPPFTRPTGHETAQKIGVPVPSFAGFNTSEEEQRAMSQRLRDIYKGIPQAAGHGNAGLASNFFDLAHTKLKPGGVLAMVVPAALAQGSAWDKTRELLDKYYDELTVVSLSTTGSTERAFSADTGMAEVLVVGKKRPSERTAGNAGVRFASLQKRPKNIAEAVIVARHILDSKGNITIGESHTGMIVKGTLDEGGIAGIDDGDLAVSCKALGEGILTLPGINKKYNVPVARISEIGDRGMFHMDINGTLPDGGPRGPFDIETLRGQPTWPCLWRHDTTRERTLVVAPDSQGAVRPGMEEKAHKVWRTASRLHFNRDFRLNSQSLAACMTPQPTIGGRAWPNIRPRDPDHREALVLWANTTLGVMLFWWRASRQQQGRANLTISQLPGLAVLDTRALGAKQHQLAKKIFRRFSEQPLLPANEAYQDPTRKALDRAVLTELLGLPESVLEGLDLLRRKWCAEPSVHGGKRTRIPAP